MKKRILLGALGLVLVFSSPLVADEKLSMSPEDRALYEEMLENNPADIYVEEGSELLEEYIGGEAGLAKFLGVSEDELPKYLAGFPRYIKKIGMVVAIDQMLQAAMYANGKKPFKLKSSQMDAMAAYTKSIANGEKINIDINANEHMKEYYKLGKKVFEMRRGGRGLSCYSCHSPDIVGMRLRMQILPDLGAPKVKAAATWPAYRMTKGKMFTLQKRFQQCMKNALLAKIPLGSKHMVALEVYVTNMAKGQEIHIPGLKR
ncbi:sulfur oxidation c-type cytochrome SoxA [Nitrosophilus kaiyonis]|uniref:sulfur oxidation c-type cytochrome SoxA n=1 Tax=Nitrosophilus kaiyonis TaxID=2930200 RepID=UPI00249088F5|nr:sulfur oxidation c-type cytochrome SoxA [Nitrosophilus kaiyonis]